MGDLEVSTTNLERQGSVGPQLIDPCAIERPKGTVFGSAVPVSRDFENCEIWTSRLLVEAGNRA